MAAGDLERAAELAGQVTAILAGRGETLAVAESLTGGLLAATIVEIPGVSAVFRGGLIVYATDLKATLAGVDEHLLAERGPVDADVAAALADGARARCGADWGLATTGVAGPSSQGGMPVGTAFVGLYGPGAVKSARAYEFPASLGRRGIRSRCVLEALELLSYSVHRSAGYSA